MASPVALIRNYEPSDKKLVQFMVGKANLQALAVANNKSNLQSSDPSVVCLTISQFIPIP